MVTITVQVITPDIALEASPSLITITAGSTGSTTISVVALGRYNGSLGRPEYLYAVLASWQRDWSYDIPRAPRRP